MARRGPPWPGLHLGSRRTARAPPPPSRTLEAAELHPRLSLTDRARIYFVCGGVPLYLELFDPARSVEQNIEHVILNEHSPLFREPDFLLREELRDVESYYAVLLALATGSAIHKEIAARTSIPERSLGYYLKQLDGGRTRVHAELQRKLAAYPNARDATLVPRLFVRKRPEGTERDAALRWHDLDDLYECP